MYLELPSNEDVYMTHCLRARGKPMQHNAFFLKKLSFDIKESEKYFQKRFQIIQSNLLFTKEQRFQIFSE